MKSRDAIAIIILLATFYVHWPIYALVVVIAAMILFVDTANVLLRERG